MKTLYLHVGPHKTGSSYLQLKLLHGRETLESNGISYPDSFFHVYGHHYLYVDMFRKNNSAAFLNEIKEINDYPGDVILSSENFSTQPEIFFRKIKELFSYDEIKVIYFYRAPSDRIYSYWQEQIKHGSHLTFSEFTNAKFCKPYQDKDLNYILFFNMVKNIFGTNSLVVIDYKKSLKNSSAVYDFFSSVGLPPIIPDQKELVNTGLDYEVIEIIRTLNTRYSLTKGLSSPRIREEFLKTQYESDPRFIFLKDKMNFCLSEIVIGDTHIDNHVYETIKTKYSGNIHGELSHLESKTKVIPNAKWCLDSDVLENLNSILNDLSL